MSEFRYVITGLGNLAWHIERMLRSSGISPALLKSDWNQNGFSSNEYQSFDYADCIVFLTVRDDSIESMAKRFKNAFLVHCSGSSSLDIIPENRGAVVWPVQTFSRGVEMDYGNIPFVLECKADALHKELLKRFLAISDRVYCLDSSSRLQLHLAAVIAQNFSNRLLAEADVILRQLDIDYSVLLPLMLGSLRKLESLPPIDAQTGPAVRGDFGVLNSHLKMCSHDSELMNIYRLISSRINPSFKHE